MTKWRTMYHISPHDTHWGKTQLFGPLKILRIQKIKSVIWPLFAQNTVNQIWLIFLQKGQNGSELRAWERGINTARKKSIVMVRQVQVTIWHV